MRNSVDVLVLVDILTVQIRSNEIEYRKPLMLIPTDTILQYCLLSILVVFNCVQFQRFSRIERKLEIKNK